MGVIEKIDDYTIRITFNRTNPLFLDKVGRFQFHPYLPEHYMGQFHPDYTIPKALSNTLKEEGFASWEKLFTAKMDVWSTEFWELVIRERRRFLRGWRQMREVLSFGCLKEIRITSKLTQRKPATVP